MLILAVDTSGKHGSIALARCNVRCEVMEVVPLQGGTFSALLVPQIAALLSAHGVSRKELDGFAVVSGPGSFTGLRVGLAAVKALAEVLHQPIAAVSLLEAVAQSGSARGAVLAALDAGRGEIYAGEYDVASHRAIVHQERLLTPDEFLKSARGLKVITPEQIIANLASEAGLAMERINRPQSDIIARLGWKKIQAGETTAPDQLEANYIRRTDAEIFAKPETRI